MEKEKALNLAASICSKKEHCSQEIREKLKKWELAESEILQIMNFLQQHQFIDDARYAQAYAEDKLRFNRWGKQKIALMLHRKKIAPEIISQTLKDLHTDNEYEATCFNLLKEKQKSLRKEELYRRKNKLIRFALGRGFDYELIEQCLNRLANETPI